MRAVVIFVAATFVGATTYFALRSNPDNVDPAPADQVGTERPRRPNSGRANRGELEAADPDTRTPEEALDTAPEEVPTTTPPGTDWIAALQDTDTNTVFDATVKLAAAGDPAAIDPLIEVLQQHKDFYCRLGAATALGQLSSWKAADPLVDALTDADQLVRAAASEALRQITGNEIKGFSPMGSADQLADGQRKWREWLAEHRPDR